MRISERTNERTEFSKLLRPPNQRISIKKIEDEAKEKNYFKKVGLESGSETIDFLYFGDHDNHLYQVDIGGKKTEMHVVWLFGFVPSDPENVNPAGVIGVDEKFEYTMRHNRDLLERVNTSLLETYTEAVSSYPWRNVPSGLCLVGNADFSMASFSRVGILVSAFSTVKGLIAAIAINQEDISAIKDEIRSEFAHELTHSHIKGDTRSELTTYIVQFVFNPKDGYSKDLESLEKERQVSDGRVTYASDNLSLMAKYKAMLLIAEELSKYNDIIKNKLENDGDPFKLSTLKELPALLGPSDHLHLEEYGKKILDENIDDNKLTDAFKLLAKKFSISYAYPAISAQAKELPDK